MNRLEKEFEILDVKPIGTRRVSIRVKGRLKQKTILSKFDKIFGHNHGYLQGFLYNPIFNTTSMTIQLCSLESRFNYEKSSIN